MSNYDPNYVHVPAYFQVGVKTIVVGQDGKILILKRSDKVSRPHGWDLVGGGVDAGEDPITSVIREAKEEIGLEILNPKPILTHYYKTDNGEDIIIIYFTATTNSLEVTLSWEHEEFKWLNPNEALKLDYPRSHLDAIRTYVHALPIT